MSLEGTWKITQQWGNNRPYTFTMEIDQDGLAKADGGFEGTAVQLTGSSQVSIGFANCKTNVIATYNGNIVGTAMGGIMVGRQENTPFNGSWSAVLDSQTTAPIKECGVGD